jgi:hypothetical protein
MTDSIFMIFIVLMHAGLALALNAYFHVPLRDYFIVTIFVKMISNDARSMARQWKKKVG